MEAAGLAVGIAALAGLCSNCVDAFNLIASAKEFSIDYEVLSIKLDVEKTRLLQWVEGVGLLAENPRDRHSSLLSIRPQLERVLQAVKLLLTKSEDLQSVYGLTRDKTSSQELECQGDDKVVKQTSIATQAKWVIKHHDKFEKLVAQVHDLICSLNDLVIIPRTFQRLMVKEDIESLGHDLPELRLLQRASEGQPAEWFECATLAIKASQKATQDFRTIEEWLEDVTNLQSNIENARLQLPPPDDEDDDVAWQTRETEIIDHSISHEEDKALQATSSSKDFTVNLVDEKGDRRLQIYRSTWTKTVSFPLQSLLLTDTYRDSNNPHATPCAGFWDTDTTFHFSKCLVCVFPKCQKPFPSLFHRHRHYQDFHEGVGPAYMAPATYDLVVPGYEEFLRDDICRLKLAREIAKGIEQLAPPTTLQLTE